MKKTETITLDKEIIASLKEQSEQRGVSLDDLINDILKEHVKESANTDC
jgi:hypothetical protein